MLKKVFLTLFVVALGIFSFGIAQATQVDGMQSTDGPTLPATLNVHVNPGGLGDALIYGYYNVRDNRDNYFNVVNTDTSSGVRARIRFLEAADASDCNGSVEVLDFDLCLSPGDVWTGIIKKVNDSAVLFSPDDDTHIDYAPPRGGADTANTFAVAFPNGIAFKSDPIVPGVSADETLEGYFIVIAEEGLTGVTTGGNCGDDLLDNNTQVDNVLFGINYAVDMDSLATFAYNASALGNFANQAFKNDPVDASPNLSDCQDTVVGLNYALTKSNLYSTYDIASDIAGKTEMIVTFPTKKITHTCSPATDDIFDDPRVLVTVWDDEENSPVSVCEFSPCPSGTDVKLPYEVNVVNLNSSDIFDTTVEVPLTITFNYGWLNIDLTDAATSAPSPAHETVFGGYVSFGLPAIGYVAIDVAGGGSTHMLPVQYSSDVELD